MEQMSDRELLTLAAKALGVKKNQIRGNMFLIWDGVGYVHWNPLIDASDALRLAATLNIGLAFNRAEDEQTVQAIWPDPSDPYAAGTFTESFGVDKHAATRLVIVRAAASIGMSV